MWGKLATVVLLVGELLLRWLQSKDRQDGKDELIKEQETQAKKDIDEANTIRNSDLPDELLIKPSERTNVLNFSTDIYKHGGNENID